MDEVDLVRYVHEMVLHRNGLLPQDSAIAESLRAPSSKLENFGSRIRVVIQAGKCDGWIARFHEFYEQLGVSPLFVIGRTTSPETRAALNDQRLAHVEIDGERKDWLDAVREAAGTDWILRIQEDELPSPGLLAFADRATGFANTFVWGFPRVYLRYDSLGNDLHYSRFLPFGPLANADIQWRLLSRSEGPMERRLAVPEALLFSLDWVVRTFAERAGRLAAQTDGVEAPTRTAPFHPFESVPEKWHMLTRWPDQRFEEIARTVARNRRPF